MSEPNFSFLFNQLVPYIPACLIDSNRDFYKSTAKAEMTIIKARLPFHNEGRVAKT